MHQVWIHSREEDTDEEVVYRPVTYDFPLSRGRGSFELKPDGNLDVRGGIAPDDRQKAVSGKWELDDQNELVFYITSESKPDRVMKIESADEDRLVLKK